MESNLVIASLIVIIATLFIRVCISDRRLSIAAKRASHPKPSEILSRLLKRVEGVHAPSFFKYYDERVYLLNRHEIDILERGLESNNLLFVVSLDEPVVVVLPNHPKVDARTIISDIIFVTREASVDEFVYMTTRFDITPESHNEIHVGLSAVGTKLTEVRTREGMTSFFIEACK